MIVTVPTLNLLIESDGGRLGIITATDLEAVTSSNASMGSGPRADAGRGLCKDQELDYQRAGEASAMAGFSFRRRSISDFFVRVLSALSTGKRFDASK